MSWKFRWALLWSLGILVLTLMPGNDVPAWPWAEAVHFDKIVHAVLFGVETVLLGRALVPGIGGGRQVRTAFLLAMVLAIAYGGAIEVLQGLMGLGRQADVLDLVADSAGALLGYGVLRAGLVPRA